MDMALQGLTVTIGTRAIWQQNIQNHHLNFVIVHYIIIFFILLSYSIPKWLKVYKNGVQTCF